MFTQRFLVNHGVVLKRLSQATEEAKYKLAIKQTLTREYNAILP